MRVLIAVDGSPPSLEAVRQAAGILSPDRDEIVLYYSPPGVDSGLYSATIERGRKAMAESVFAKAVGHLCNGWQSKTRTCFGTTDAREGILQAAADQKCDLIVVGARGLSRFERLLLGSVSRAVVHAARMPVLVVRVNQQRRESSNFRVLLAFESVDRGNQLALTLGRFAWPAGTAALSIQVVQNVFGGEVPRWLDDLSRAPDAEAMIQLWAKDHEAQIEAASRQISEVCRQLPHGLADAGHCVREGSPQEAILRVAQADHSDLIVIGSKTTTRLQRLLVGSTAEAILNHAPCSVLIVPPALQAVQGALEPVNALASQMS